MLRLTLVTVSLFVVPVSVSAATCANSILPDAPQSRVGRVTCSNCSWIADFARYGAAVLQDNRTSSSARRYNRVVVSNAKGNSVNVHINSLTRGTGVYIGYGPFSFQIRQGNRARLGVTATPRTNGVSGSPWINQPTLVSELTKVCDAIELEKEAKEKEEKEEKEEKAEQTSQYYYNKYLQTDAYKQRQSFIQETNNRWQRMLDWEFILRTKYNDHRTICSPTYSGVRCDRYRYSRNFNGY